MASTTEDMSLPLHAGPSDRQSARARWTAILVLMLASLCATRTAWASEIPGRDETEPPLILAHYMPWFQARPFSNAWGWHWTMQAFDPEQVADGRRSIASHFYPLIGPYDSGDPAAIEYHLLLMKLAGIDGVIVDWYGLEHFRDYPMLHQNTSLLIEQLSRLEMRFAICYEDQTIPALVEADRLADDQRVDHALLELQWISDNWFELPGYVQVDGNPLLLSFGQTGLSADEWTSCLERLPNPVAYFSQHYRRPAAVGAFDWPVPDQGLSIHDAFRQRSRQWSRSIPVAFPRFVDIYEQARVHASWGMIPDDDGKTFQDTLESALASGADVIQLATWNDWGEGTMIEPSVEFGYRDLESIQRQRRETFDADFPYTAEDLAMPLRLFQCRREAIDPEQIERLDRISRLIADGRLAEARSNLSTELNH